MAAALQQAQQEHQTLGQVVGPEVRDQIMRRYPTLGGEVQEITVLFADIRGFTRRSAVLTAQVKSSGQKNTGKSGNALRASS